MYYKFFMADGDDAGGNMGGEAAPASDAPAPEAPAVDMVDVPETGGVTADDVAEIMNLPKSAPTEENKADPTDSPATDDNVPTIGNDDDDASDGDTVVPPAVEDTPPAAPPKVEDPTPAETPDFSFTVEGADGNTYKISPDATMEEVLAEWEPKNNGQILDVLEQLREAKASQKDYEAEQVSNQEETARTERIAAIQEGWASEAKALVADGRLENSTDLMGSDRVKEVFAYMKEENDKRSVDGRPQIASLEDAFDKLELKEQREAAAKAKDDAKANARKNGSLVSGGGAPAANNGPSYVAGAANNVDQAMRQLGLLR